MVRHGWAASDAHAVAHTFADRLIDRVELDGADAHHLSRARRVRAGERLTVADGAGHWRSYEVAAVGAHGLSLDAVDELRREPDPPVDIGVAPALSKRGIDRLAAEATELGAVRIVPVVTARTVVRWDDDKRMRLGERLARIVREAAMQCRRCRIPVVEAVSTPEMLATRPGLVLADITGSRASELVPPTGGEWLVLSGPEGGFETDELNRLATVPRLALGHHVLRAETAPVAAVAVLRQLSAAWDAGDP